MKSNELKAINRQLFMYQLIGFPGAVAVGIGALGLNTEGEQLFAFLESELICMALVGIGVVAIVWEAFSIWPLLKKKAEIEKNGT